LNEVEEKYLFDKNYFPTGTVQENIEQSGLNFYGETMTTKIYNDSVTDSKNKLNAYFEQVDDEVICRSYSVSDLCGEFMINCVKWFEKALAVAKSSPDYFDAYTVKSLEYLIEFYKTGDEKYFKLHSVEWLKMKNPKVSYTAGFIEVYDDPMSHIGRYQADVTINSLNIDTLLKLLPSFEERFPFPREFKRKDMTAIPNAVTAYKIMGIGGLGPVLNAIAYCLPNYNDIRSEVGSKQIMYELPSNSNMEKYGKLYFSLEDQKFFQTYSPNLQLESVVKSLCTILHETIGHASGANIEGVTNEIKNNNIGKWCNGLEEMRAEILALYTGIYFYDEIVESGVLGDWPKTIPKDKMFELMLQGVAGNGWQRWRSTPVGSMEVKQAHALADTGIMYYLIDHSDGALELKEETVLLDDTEIHVLRLIVHDMYKILPAIKQLAIIVQTLSSTAIFEDINNFMTTYAVSTRNSQYSSYVKQMTETLSQGCKSSVQIYPEWHDDNGDITVRIPEDAIDSTLRIWQLAMQK
jgi:hypothetical protein